MPKMQKCLENAIIFPRIDLHIGRHGEKKGYYNDGYVEWRSMQVDKG